jgi:lysophospholipase L1-like esterase
MLPPDMFPRTFVQCLVFTALTLAAVARLHAEAPAIPQQKETDPNLPPKGGSWSLREATVTDPSLPRVLLIGDSITNGYLEPVRKALSGKANIDAWITPTTQADKSLPKTVAAILGWQKYAVVHFNLGLHGWQKGRIPEGQYEALTRQLVQNLRAGAPQATLIWATITPVTVKGEPEKLNPEIQPTIEEHNRMALAVMKSEGVEIDDLARLMAGHLPMAAGDMFHWKPAGVALLTESVTKSIATALEKQKPK